MNTNRRDPAQVAEERRERRRLARERRAAGEAFQALVHEFGFDEAYRRTFAPHVVGTTPTGEALVSSSIEDDPVALAAEEIAAMAW